MLFKLGTSRLLEVPEVPLYFLLLEFCTTGRIVLGAHSQYLSLFPKTLDMLGATIDDNLSGSFQLIGSFQVVSDLFYGSLAFLRPYRSAPLGITHFKTCAWMNHSCSWMVLNESFKHLNGPKWIIQEPEWAWMNHSSRWMPLNNFSTDNNLL